jgi:hypothetical protein
MISQRNLLSRACLQGADQPLEARKVVRDSGYAAKEPELKEQKKVSFMKVGSFVKKLLGGDTLKK